MIVKLKVDLDEKETARNEKHNDMFLKKQSSSITTRNMFVLEEPYCKTERYYKSAIPFMSRTLNGVYLSRKNVWKNYQ